MARRQIERRLDATLLDLGGMFPAGLETPRLRGRARTFVVTDLHEKELLPSLFRKSGKLRATLLPRCRNLSGTWVCRLRQREIGKDADVIERVPEFHVGILIPVRSVSDFAVIYRPHGRDDLAPTFLVYLRIGKLEADAKNLRVLAFSQRRHLHDPRFVVSEEPVPFFRGDEVNVAAPAKLRPPI